MSQLRVLVTGFAPFRGRALNTSSLVVRVLERLAVSSVELHVRPEVPVVWADRTVIEEAQELDAKLVIAVGEAAMTNELRLERVARNLARGPDEHGLHHQALVEGGAPAQLESTVPPGSWRRAIDALRHEGWNAARHGGPRWLNALGLGPPDWDNSAGSFLCNATFYRLLHEASTSHRWVSLIHVRIDGDPDRLGQALKRVVEVWSECLRGT